MVWLIVFVVIAALPVWMFFASVEACLDTRVPAVVIQWQSIGRASIFFENEVFWLQVHLFFWQRQWRMTELTKKSKSKKVQAKRSDSEYNFRKAIQIMKCIRVKQCHLFLHPDDYMASAQLYFLNFVALPHPYKLSVGFTGASYLLLKIKTAPWRVLYAWLRK